MAWRDYELGHLIDRCAGGHDTIDNLTVMCVLCNRLKPVHDHRDDAELWIAQGGVLGEFGRWLQLRGGDLTVLVAALERQGLDVWALWKEAITLPGWPDAFLLEAPGFVVP